MRKEKGFTLIELLAVIVILAIIALIAVPIIMGVIGDAKKGAAKDSMYAYVKAVELSTAKDLQPDTDLLTGTFQVKNGNLMSGDTVVLTVYLKGTKPANDNGDITLDKGLVINADLKFDEYCIGYDGEKSTNKEDCKNPPPTIGLAVGTVVYYNPVTNTKCNSSDAISTTGTKTGCMKWNVVTLGDSESKPTIEIMLDHNSTEVVAWVTKEDYIADGGTEASYGDYGSSDRGPVTAIKQIKADVSSWDVSVKNTVRLITGQEVAAILNNKVWNVGGTEVSDWLTFNGNAWLYPNLRNPMAEANGLPVAYWTATKNTGSTRAAWAMSYNGRSVEMGNYDAMMATAQVYDGSGAGVRPIITISKAVIS